MIYKGSGAEHIGFGNSIFVKRFPDGEIYVKVPKVEKKVFYIQSFYPGQNDKLLEALLTIDALYDNGTNEVKLISLYFPYTKQDKIFSEGEALSVKTVLKLFSSVGISEIHFINAHFLREEGFFREWGMDLYNHNAASLLKENIKADMFVLPGRGAYYLLEGENVFHVKTKRDEKYEDIGEKIFRKPNVFIEDLDVKNKTVAVVDDMISTGGTMAKTVELLKKLGSKKVIASAVHGLFVGEAEKKLSVADEIITTNTVVSKFSKVDVTPLVRNIVENYR